MQYALQVTAVARDPAAAGLAAVAQLRITQLLIAAVPAGAAPLAGEQLLPLAPPIISK